MSRKFGCRILHSIDPIKEYAIEAQHLREPHRRRQG
jgi:hypothetical protein